MHDIVLRLARDDDSAGVIALIGAVFAEYPGCVLDVDREEPELRAPASSFDGFWVLERGGGVLRAASAATVIVGCIGLGLHGAGPAELKKLYLARELRGRGLGARLVGLVEDEARRRGATHIELWTDTRFTTAHTVYARLGYTRTGAQRELHDLSATVEEHYTKALIR
jgi:putative acetyltransferase